MQKILAQLRAALQQLDTLLESMQQKRLMQTIPPQTPPSSIEPPQPAVQEQTPKGSPTLIDQCCGLIRTFEGYVLPGGRDAAGNIYPHGSPAYVNNNPGNIRCLGPRSQWPSLAVACSPSGFCQFKTYQDGWSTLVNGITAIALGNAATGGAYQIAARKLGLKDCSQMTLDQFFEIRDPSSDKNNPKEYSQFVGKGLGVDSSNFRMCQLVE